MNNKGEKSFSDLFLSANDDAVKKDEVTFGAFSNSTSNEEKNVSFSNFSNMANVNNNISNVKEITTENNIDSNIFNVASSVVSDLQDTEEEKQINNVSFNVINNNIDNVEKENILDTNVEVNDNESNSFNFFDMSSSVGDNTNEQLNIENELNDASNNEIGMNSNIGAVDISSFDNVEIVNNDYNTSNLDDLVTSNDEDSNKVINTEEENIFMSINNSNDINENNNVQESVIEDDNANKITEEFSNVFGFSNSNNDLDNNEKKGVIELNSTSIVNSIFDDTKKDVKKEEEKKKSSVDSPFFAEEETNSNNAELNPLLANNTISLDEGSKTKKNVGKINLSNTKNYEVKVVPKNEPLIKFIIGVLSYAFFIWLLLIGVTLLVYVLDIKIRASKGDYSAPTFNAYVVLTGSMLPDIQVNDVVVTKKVEAETLKVGDIITFASADSRFAGTIITHRIIKVNPSKDKGGITFQTKGDNNNVADSTLVPEANIYGKVILKIPKLGYLQEFLATDGGWILVILIPCLTVISYDVVKLFKGLKRKKYDNIKVKK